MNCPLIIRDWNAQGQSSYEGPADTDPGGDIEVSYCVCARVCVCVCVRIHVYVSIKNENYELTYSRQTCLDYALTIINFHQFAQDNV